MASIEDLEAKKKAVQLEKDIAKIELEKKVVAFLTTLRWPLLGLAAFALLVLFAKVTG